MSEVYSLMEAYHQVYQPQDVNEDFNDWIDFLIQEGYDLNDYTDEELLDAYLGEARVDDGKTDVEKRVARRFRLSSDINLGRQEDSLPPHSIGTDELEQGRQWKHKKFRGVKKPEAKSRPKPSPGKYFSMQRRKRNKKLAEQLDLYDIISEYLVSEGFCESYEDADVIMANMSEEWREDILDEVVGFGGKVDPNTGKWDTDAKPTSPQQRRISGSPTRSSNVRGGSHRYYTNASGYHNQMRNETRPEGSGTGLSMSPVRRAELAAGRAARQGQKQRANSIRTRMGIQ